MVSKTIKKTGLVSTRKSLPISLLRTRELIMEEVRPLLLRYEITEQQWRVLRVVQEAETEIDASTIANRACLLAPSLTRILKTLRHRGYLKIHKNQKDGRRIKVILTEDGHDLIEKIAPQSIELFQKLRTIVGEDCWESLVELLAGFRDDINQARKSQERAKYRLD